MALNPYAAPLASSEHEPDNLESPLSGAYREGDFLLVPPQFILPRQCVHTGGAVPLKQQAKKVVLTNIETSLIVLLCLAELATFPFIGYVSLALVFFTFVVMLVLQKNTQLAVFYRASLYKRIAFRDLICCLGILLPIPLSLFAASSPTQHYLFWIAFAVLVTVIIIGLLISPKPKLKVACKVIDYCYVSGVHSDILKRYPDAPKHLQLTSEKLAAISAKISR